MHFCENLRFWEYMPKRAILRKLMLLGIYAKACNIAKNYIFGRIWKFLIFFVKSVNIIDFFMEFIQIALPAAVRLSRAALFTQGL